MTVTAEDRAPHSAPVIDDRRVAAIAAIHRISQSLGGRALSIAEYRAHVAPGEPSGITVVRVFGGWNSAVTAAGLPVNPVRKFGGREITADQVYRLIAEAARAYERESGRPATRMTKAYYSRWRTVAGGQLLSATAIGNRYGPWRAVVEAAVAQHSVVTDR